MSLLSSLASARDRHLPFVRHIASFPGKDWAPAQHVRVTRRRTVWVRDLPGPRGAPTLLLLHGLLATADINWGTSYNLLTPHFRVIAIDHQGHGRSSRPHGLFRLEGCADDAAEVCRQLGVDKVTACGYSMGGPVAALVWQRHRSLVDSLVLAATVRRFNGGHVTDKAGLAALLATTLAIRGASNPLLRWTESWLMERMFGGDPVIDWVLDDFRRQDPIMTLEAIAAIQGFDGRPWMSDIDVPTSVVVTTKDQWLPPWRQHVLADHIPGAKVFEVAANHPTIVEEGTPFPAAFLDACLAATGTAHQTPKPRKKKASSKA